MSYYVKRGEVPHKRHTQFRDKDGNLYYEELFSTEGFSSNYSLLYHIFPPTQILRTEAPRDVAPVKASENILKHRAFEGFDIKAQKDFLESRKTVLFNDDVAITLASPQKSTKDYFYKNGDSDEVIFIHEGTGNVRTAYGKLNFKYGDYIVIPRGTVYQINFDTKDNRILIVESHSPVAPPKRYLSRYGQLLEHSPFCERDIHPPEFVEPVREEGEFMIYTKKKGLLYPIVYANHPFDLVGWDGCEYPYITSIHDFEPITGRVHQPPPVHQQFDAHNFVICSFVPRLYDYHPESIPAPYAHSNIDSDEVLYYVDGEFMSRKNVSRGMITLHPAGIPHGPHPGTIEKSIGKSKTEELAVMVDTFRPLYLTEAALDIELPGYETSWVE